MSPENLRRNTRSRLARMARQHGVEGWHAMRKEQLVTALLKVQPAKSLTARGGQNGANHAGRTAGKSTTLRSGEVKARPAPSAARKVGAVRKPTARPAGAVRSRNGNGNRLRVRSLVPASPPGAIEGRDGLVLQATDANWLHARWHVTRTAVDRAAAALGSWWHNAVPVLRLYEVGQDAEVGERLTTEVELPPEARHWYIRVNGGAPRVYACVGYRAPDGRFATLTRSNVVQMPRSGALQLLDKPWEEIEELIAQQARRDAPWNVEGPAGEFLGNLLCSPLRNGRTPNGRRFLQQAAAGLDVDLQVELIVHGHALPGARVQVLDQTVRVGPQGKFAMQMKLPEGRHVLAVHVLSPDGEVQRTIVLGVERNTKELDPQGPDEA
jgi:hypothetical protein